MNIFNGSSIRHRFIFTLVSVVVFIFLIFSTTIIYQNVSTIETQLDKQLLDASNLAEKSLSSALWQYNHDFVADFIESLFLYEDIVFAKVLSGNEVIKEKINSGFPGKDFLFFQQSFRFSTKETDINFAGKTIGKIQIALTRDRIKKTIFHNSAITIIFALLMISAIISIIYFISKRYIFAPLSKLENSAAEIAEGDWDADIDTSGTDEIGNLSKTFDKMIKNLKATTASRDELEREIRERIQAQEAEKQEHALSNAIIDSIPGTFYMLDVNGRYVRWNTYQRDEIVGKSESQMADVNAIDTIHPDDHQIISSKIENVLKNGSEETVEGRVLLRGGPTFRWFLMTGRQMMIKGSPFLIGTGIDITERKRAEEEQIKLEDKLHRAQKMESLGLMAGGIAHDLNNILSGIVSYPELLLMDISEESPLRKPIETIKESGIRAAEVVAELLTIARGVATGKETLNLNTIVSEYVKTPEYQKLEKTHPSVNLTTDLNPDLLNVTGSSTHIKKILMNLMTNASEAIEGTGTIAISTRNQYLDEPLKGYEDVHIGEYAVLIVSDNGSGISSQDLERIFEPFYTKKVMGRTGTGLGLTVVWNTVRDHDGYINVSTSETGTVFELYFPVTRKEVAAHETEVAFEDYVGRGETVLVVDDVKRQREIASGMLTKLGYNAEAVSSGEEAVEYVKKHPVDLIVLDMVMPKGIGGRETYEEIIKFRPGQKAIIASGFSETEDVKIAQTLGAGRYVKKPYTMEKIGLAVKEELEK